MLTHLTLLWQQKIRLSFVLYMSMRIHSEHLTQEEFVEEFTMNDNYNYGITASSAGDYSLLLDEEENVVVVGVMDSEVGSGGSEVVATQVSVAPVANDDNAAVDVNLDNDESSHVDVEGGGGGGSGGEEGGSARPSS